MGKLGYPFPIRGGIGNGGSANWVDPVINRTTTTPPVSPGMDDRYIVGTGATGAWSGKDDQIAQWDGLAWVFTVQTLGMTTYVNRSYLTPSKWDSTCSSTLR